MTRGVCKGVCAIILFCSVWAVFAPGAAQAARFSGKYLLELCDIGPDGKEVVAGGHAVCQAYIAGVIDYHAMLQGFKIAPKLDVCVPKNVTLNQLHAVVLRYLKQNTQHDNFIAAPAVTMAIYQVYPCARAKK